MLRRLPHLVVLAVVGASSVACSSSTTSRSVDACSTLDGRAVAAITGWKVDDGLAETVPNGTACVWRDGDDDAVAVTVGDAGSASELDVTITDSTAHLGPSADLHVAGATRAVEFPDDGLIEMAVGGRLVTVQQRGVVETGPVHARLADAVARGM